MTDWTEAIEAPRATARQRHALHRLLGNADLRREFIRNLDRDEADFILAHLFRGLSDAGRMGFLFGATFMRLLDSYEINKRDLILDCAKNDNDLGWMLVTIEKHTGLIVALIQSESVGNSDESIFNIEL